MAALKRMTAVGAFEDWKQGQNALHDLLRKGFSKEQLGILARGGDNWIWDVRERQQERRAAGHQAWRSGILGAGAEDLWLVGLAAGELPDIGPTLAGGALTPVLEGNAGLLQELTERGIPDQDAQYYEDQFRRGKTLVVADVAARSMEAASIMHRCGAQASLFASSHSRTCLSPN